MLTPTNFTSLAPLPKKDNIGPHDSTNFTVKSVKSITARTSKFFTPTPWSAKPQKYAKVPFNLGLNGTKPNNSSTSKFDLFLDYFSDNLKNSLSKAQDDIGSNYVKNFINADQNNFTIDINRESFSDMSVSQVLSRASVCFNQFINKSGPTPYLDKLKEKINSSVDLTEEETKDLLEHLSSRTIINNEDNSKLYTNKLLKPENFPLEFPGDAASVKDNGKITERQSNQILVTKFGFPDSILSRPKEGHETYGLKAFKNAEGQEITLGTLFGGALQGINRAKPDLDKSKFDGYHDPNLMSAGSLAWEPEFNSGMYEKNTDLLGKDILDFAKSLNEENNNMINIEGFTAGVSGNALHYVIQTALYCKSTGKDFDFNSVLKQSIDHLVGDSFKVPLHHSLPEVVQGAFFAKVFVDKGILEASSTLMNDQECLELLTQAKDDANSYVQNLLKN